jgi:hypothetical protein
MVAAGEKRYLSAIKVQYSRNFPYFLPISRIFFANRQDFFNKRQNSILRESKNQRSCGILACSNEFSYRP